MIKNVEGSRHLDGLQGHQSMMLPDGCIYIVGGWLPSSSQYLD